MRLFVSLPLPPPVREHLARALDGFRTTTVEQWHVTLAFVGEWDDPDLLVPGLAEAAAESPPLDLHLESGGTFARVLWVGVGGDVAGLHRLAASVAQACRAAGVPLERRPYRPHVTVAHRPRHLHVLDSYRGPAWTASSLDLVQSVLGKRAVHTVLRTLPLGGSATTA